MQQNSSEHRSLNAPIYALQISESYTERTSVSPDSLYGCHVMLKKKYKDSSISSGAICEKASFLLWKLLG